MEKKVYDLIREKWQSSITNISVLKEILEQWYNMIVWNIDFDYKITGRKISSLAEFIWYDYEITWNFECQGNSISNFEWFPAYIWWDMNITWNLFESFKWMPLIKWEWLFLEWNSFDTVTEVIKWILYKHWGEYFYIKNSEHKKYIDQFIELNKPLSNGADPFRWNFLVTYKLWVKIKSAIEENPVVIKNKTIMMWGKLYLKEILNINGTNNTIDDISKFEIKNLSDTKISINWNIFHKGATKIF
jgi:hypothetical protein